MELGGNSRNERIIVLPLYARGLWWMERINPWFLRVWNREIVRRHAKREVVCGLDADCRLISGVLYAAALFCRTLGAGPSQI
jgi:hypothetical protein